MESVNFKTAVTLCGLGVLLIAVCIPLYLGKIKMNTIYGFRFRRAFESEENWYQINKYGAKVLMGWSLIIMAVGVACLYIAPEHVLSAARVSFLLVIFPIIQTLYYARRL